ncbi:nuclease PA3 [Magnaporthiopsis poae ATCC 64411]|uniref:Nuclease PA3 n=1 Tax=Magnaporthiopsis poae (strain ATCC 64411 / 73-15) TaxID=644358 RepID=A0A0C4DQ58_MAGP6|nr:nuclease PA3 [Magnaporthiopsis poae ATCC 64411]
MRLLSAGTLGLLALPGAQAWGSLGHITVAYVAQDFVSAPTEAYLKTLLRNDTDSYLAGVATWADSIRYTKWGHFTGELSGEYYEKAAPVIEVQVARAGFRLARWLDLMVASLHESGDVGEL